jgi:tripartite-type tricarboxylate transporter receptor subunit TctC
LVHVPYRGSYFPDLIGGQVQVVFAPMISTVEYIRAGALRALAVTTATRADRLPDVPTIGDFVPGYEASGWQGIGAPKNTAPEIIVKLNDEINASLADPKRKSRFSDLGVEPTSMTPAQFEQFIADDTEKWAKVIRAGNIKPE